MGSIAKQPMSLTGAAVVRPPCVSVSMVAFRGGMIWPSKAVSAISSSMEKWAEVKVRARTEAGSSDRRLALRSLSLRES